jgi:peptidyl-prolyl cis-trans isomerase B (cyclophilin B)
MEFSKANPEKKLWIYTSFGKIKVRLYEQTPLHRASFLLWTKSGFYDGSVFMRVSPNFIAQGGTTNSDRQMEIKKRIGQYTIPAEFRPGLFHKRGALAFARDYENNPQKRSDSHRFYFVEGTMYNKPTLDKYERETGRKYPKEIREYYLVQPGAAHLDYEHTVFGEVLHGMDVIAKITRVDTDSREWPLKDVYIDSIRIIVKKP